MEYKKLKLFLEDNCIRFYENISVKPYVTIGVGGTVRMIIVVNDENQLKELLLYMHQEEYKYVFLGGGSNVVFPDDFSPLLVIINRTSGIFCESENLIRVNSGVFINDLMKWCISNNAGGMEFLAGIPGTVGGATAVNAGAFGKSISTFLIKAEILNKKNQIKTIDNSDFEFSYRNSKYKYSDEVILSVFLKYINTPGAEIKEKVEYNINYRKQNHPGFSQRSAGCFFKNPEIDGQKLSAGRLIEQAGFKGQIYKNLEISSAHANFIINSNNASFNEVCDLENTIKAKVSGTSNITLQREVIYISPEGLKY